MPVTMKIETDPTMGATTTVRVTALTESSVTGVLSTLAVRWDDGVFDYVANSDGNGGSVGTGSITWTVRLSASPLVRSFRLQARSGASGMSSLTGSCTIDHQIS